MYALWIDELCINQNDHNERNYQVTQMGQIFSRAQRVVIWLGDEDNASSSAISAIPNVPHYISNADQLYGPLSSVDLESFKAFCTRSYWGRLWIIQETVLAEDILVQCGDKTATWHSLRRFFDCLDRFLKYIEESVNSEKMFDEDEPIVLEKKASMVGIQKTVLAKLIREWHHQMFIRAGNFITPSDLYGLCQRYQGAKCENPLDKVYGLLAIAAKCCSDAISVDYSRSKYDLCGMVLQHQALAHVYDEVESMPDPMQSGQILQRHSNLDMKTAQNFQRALGVTTIDCQDAIISRISTTPLYKLISKFNLSMLSHKLRRHPSKGSAPRVAHAESNPIGSTSDSRDEITAPIDEKNAPVVVTGIIRGRVLYLSPTLKQKDQVDWKSLGYRPTDYDKLVYKVWGYIRYPAKEASSINCEFDLVSSDIGISRADYSSLAWLALSHDDFSSFSGYSSDSGHSSDDGDVIPGLSQIWKHAQAHYRKVKKESRFRDVGAILHDCRIAIEENGFMCFVPVDTQLDDVYLCFPAVGCRGSTVNIRASGESLW